MQIFNTLSGKKEKFLPSNPPEVSFYTCGPTVYDLFHIGNGRTFIMSDILRRYLIYKGYNVKYVMNLTDIDDRIIEKSNSMKTKSSCRKTPYDKNNLYKYKYIYMYIYRKLEDIKHAHIYNCDVSVSL